ncbi:MAG: NUDIX domain-containing protein [Candidatus Saccharimonadales bacterium]
MNEPNKVPVGIACFVWRDGKFLIMHRAGTHAGGVWSVPGGHLEVGESWEETAAREVMEETGMQVKNIRFLAVTNDIMNLGKHYVSIWMTANWAAGEPENREPEKCSDMQWCDFATLPLPLFEPCWQNLRAAKPELFA